MQNRKTTTRGWAVIAGMLALLATPTAWAAGGRAHPPASLHSLYREAGAVLEAGLVQAEATPEQRARIREILAGSALELRGAAPEVLRLADRVAAALLADHPDEAELQSLQAEGLSLAGELATTARTTVVAAARVLTPEQRARLLGKWQRWARQVLTPAM